MFSVWWQKGLRPKITYIKLRKLQPLAASSLVHAQAGICLAASVLMFKVQKGDLLDGQVPWKIPFRCLDRLYPIYCTNMHVLPKCILKAMISGTIKGAFEMNVALIHPCNHIYICCCICRAIQESRAGSCQMCNCEKAACNVCNCAIWEFPLFQVAALCKWACFCPPAIIPCCVVKMRVQLGDKSQLEWHNPPRIGRSHCATPKTVPQHCHWAGAVGSFASPLKLVIGPGGINCFLISWYFWLVQRYQRHDTTIIQTPAVE